MIRTREETPHRAKREFPTTTEETARISAASKTKVDIRSRLEPVEAAGGPRAGRFLVVGHSYVLSLNQQKIEALGRLCGHVGVLAPSNWTDREQLFVGRSYQFDPASSSLSVLRVAALRPGHIASHLYAPLELRRALRGFRPDLVQVDQEVYALSSAQVAVAAKAVGAKVIVFGWENLDRPIHPMQRLARRIVFALADAVVCGNTDGAGLVRKWGFRGRIEVIPQLGVDPQLFRPRREARDRPFTVGFLGRLVPEKGVDILLRAVKRLVGSAAPIRLRVCGAGPCRREWAALAAELDVEDRVDWVDAVEPAQVPEVMKDFDVVALPSRSVPAWKEQFGHVLIEAMAMGIPVVGAESGAIPEVIGCEALTFPEEDEIALADRLRRLMEDANWRGEAAEQGRKRVLERFTHERIAEQLAGLWAGVLNGSRRQL